MSDKLSKHLQTALDNNLRLDSDDIRDIKQGVKQLEQENEKLKAKIADLEGDAYDKIKQLEQALDDIMEHVENPNLYAGVDKLYLIAKQARGK